MHVMGFLCFACSELRMNLSGMIMMDHDHMIMIHHDHKTLNELSLCGMIVDRIDLNANA